MKKPTRAAALLLALFLVLGCFPARAAENPLTVSLSGELRGLYLSTVPGGDFPGLPDLPKKELKAKLDEIVTFAAEHGYTTLYFEAASNGEAMYRSGKYGYRESLYSKGSWFSRLFQLDPLDYLVTVAKKKGIAVAAVVSPFSAASSAELPEGRRSLAAKRSEYVLPAAGKLWFDPAESFTQKLAVASVKELAKKYELSAIVLRDFAYPSADFELYTTDEQKRAALTSLLTTLRQTAQKERPGITLGVEASALPGSGFDGFAELSAWASSGLIDFLAPAMTLSASGGYAEELSAWKSIAGKLPVYTVNSAARLSASAGASQLSEPFELESQLYLNNQQGGSGCIISGYRHLSSELSATAQSLTAMFSPQPELPLNGMSLDYPAEFVLTRPAEPLTTSAATYYITGLSDGSAPVLLDGEEIGQGRTFGALVALESGRNEFTFTCGSQTQTAVITRSGGGGGTPATITEARQSTLFPTRQELTYPGDKLTLTCVAPSGAEITALVDGQYVELTQDALAEDGIPARFSGTLTLTDGYPADEVTNLGPVTYSVYYNGATKESASNGTLFAVGKDARLAVEVIDQRGDTSAVNTAADFRDNMIGSVETGARDYLVEESYSFFRLSCGGWVDREDVSVLAGRADIDAVMTGTPAFSTDDKGETFRLNMGGARPYYLTSLTDTELTVTFSNTSGIPEQWDTAGSRLFRSIKAEYNAESNSTRVTLTLAQKRLWGYNVEYHDNEVWIFAKNTPVLSNVPGKPLTGLTIVVDAGHGGNDPGAIGVAGKLGPVESQLNYINACMTSIRLEQLGATVLQTQTADERLSYAQRMDSARDSRADFYICLHHNSTAETVDSTNARGVEVYYIEGLAKPFAEVMAEELSAATGRKNRGALFATFRVTQMTHTPSLLVELGFVVSPAEYAELCDPLSVYRASLGIGNAVIRAVREAN